MQRQLRRLQDSELGSALLKLKTGLTGIIVVSACINVLVLTGSIYLMLVYDRVLPSGSGATLLSLFFMVTVAYAFYGAFDVMRSHMLSDIGASLDRTLSHRVQRLELDMAVRSPRGAERQSPIRDLDQIRGFLVGPGPSALIDLPWIVFFLAVLTAVDIWLGVATFIGAIVLAILTMIADRVSKRRVAVLGEAAQMRQQSHERNRRHAEIIAALGMREPVLGLSAKANETFLTAQTRLSEMTASLGGISKVFRMFLQSVVLSVGALLVIDGQASAGIIFASSILSSRALAPVDQAIANWRGFVQARQSWARLDQLLTENPAERPVEVALPAPSQALTVERLTLVPPGSERIAVADIGFEARAGDAVGIIGPSASGKSSLLRGLLGVWPAARGTVRLDGAAIQQWAPETLGRHIGYLPQSVELFGGSIAQNIARFDPQASSEAVLAAAHAAGVHDLILKLPGGYEMQVGEDGTMLSAGQRQRIALARALYGNPFLVALDEPNSNLDPEGEQALAGAIKGVRERGGIVLLVAHRLAILNTVNLVLALRNGQLHLFGKRDEVLAKLQGKPAPTPGAVQPVGATATGGTTNLTVVSERK